METKNLISHLKISLLQNLNERYPELEPQIKKDVNEFIKASKDKLIRWSLLLSEGKLLPSELEWLLKSQQALLSLTALQKVGISKIKLNNLKKSIIKTTFEILLATAL